MPKNKKSIEENIIEYKNYFQEDMNAIDEELKKSETYSKIIDEQIDALSGKDSLLGPTKGSQHYLIEHITNAVSLQTQRQSLRKDKFTIKKAILDYASKFAEDESGNSTDVLKAIENLLEKDKEKPISKEKPKDSEGLDQEIDKILGEAEK